ncbi:hypothetical protein LguiA_033946 [Lonicera macranthoides]
MANNDKQSTIIVHSDDDEQQPPASLGNLVGLLLISLPPENEPNPNDEKEQKRAVILMEAKKFYEILESPAMRGINYFRCSICHGSGRAKLLKGLMSILQHAQTVISLEL